MKERLPRPEKSQLLTPAEPSKLDLLPGGFVAQRPPGFNHLLNLPLEARRQFGRVVEFMEVASDRLRQILSPQVQQSLVNVGEPPGRIEQVNEVGRIRQGRPSCHRTT